MDVRASGRRKALLFTALALLQSAVGCQPDEASERASGDASYSPEQPAITDATDVAKTRPGLCDRAGDDTVRDVFCSGEPASIQSLVDLEHRLRFDYSGPSSGADPRYQMDTASYAAVLGHSTALSGHLVSPINPRAILINAGGFLAFSRGVQQVEIAAFDRTSQRVNFYLVRFEQDCNAAGGCSHGELYTPQIESNWRKVALQDDEDLKNTPSDCRQCHMRGLDAPMPLMRELRGPWTHFFGTADQNPLPFPEALGGDLSRDYLRAKGDEVYAGVPAEILVSTVGFTLQNSVSPAQPLEFDGDLILNQLWPWSPEGYQPGPTPSAAWHASFDAFKRGDQLALPYHAGRATDLDKQSVLSDAYQAYRRGELSADGLPDLGDIYPDDAQLRAEMGLQNVPGSTPAELLVQACGTCHNDVLDQSLSRARFNIALQRLDPSELDVAIGRLQLPRGAAGAMPPKDARQLDPDSRAALIAYLQQPSLSAEDQALLQHAAERGMAGPQLIIPDPADLPFPDAEEEAYDE